MDPVTAPRLTDLTERAWQLVAEREEHLRALDNAVERVPGPSPVRALQEVVEKMPLALSVETASVRIRDADEEGQLHLVAISGAPSSDSRRLAHTPLSIARARTVLAVGSSHSLARGLGLTWLHGVWLESGGTPIGLVLVGTRTERRPSDDELERLHAVGAALAERLGGLNRSMRSVRALTLELGRVLDARDPDVGRIGDLRPRERAVLDLYADGYSTAEIAEMLVISPHTVRTHVKLAMRRLGLHKRSEATELVREHRVLQLL